MAEILHYLRFLRAKITGHGKWEASQFKLKPQEDTFFRLAKHADWRETVMGDRNAWEVPMYYIEMRNRIIECTSDQPEEISNMHDN